MDPTSSEYATKATELREQALKNPYQRALRSSTQNFSGRGMIDSGLAGQERGRLQQGFLHDVGQFAGNAALKGADVEEQRRRAEANQRFQMALQNSRFNFQREMQGKAEELAKQRANQQLLGSVFSGVGGLAGTFLGSQFGLGGGGNQGGGGYAPPAGSGALSWLDNYEPQMNSGY